MDYALGTARLPDGTALPYIEQGDPWGTPVLLVHAYVDSWRSFESMLPHLPSSLHVLAPTMRGHGDADKPEVGYALEDLASDLASFLDAVEVGAAVVVGSSSGGYAAQRFALDFPDRALGMVLFGTPRSLREKPALVDAVSALEDPVDEAFVREFVTATTSATVPSEFLDAMVRESSKVPARVWRAALQGLTDAAPPTEAGIIRTPTLLIWGEEDAFLEREDQELLAASIRDAKLVVYEGTGHLVHWEEPARAAADITAFVDSVML